MFMSAAATAAGPRGSYHVPININLQGSRRRPTRGTPQASHLQEQMWRVGEDGRLKALVPVSSVGEDRAILLGFVMIGFSVLMFFVVGMTTVKPYVNSNWAENTSCVLVQVELLEDWVDCRGVSSMPCLQATVNLSDSGRPALLHQNEDSLRLAPQCFYVPKCHMDERELRAEALVVKENLEELLGEALSCLADSAKHPDNAILHRRYTLEVALFALQWPGLMLAGGALLVMLVKLTQRQSLVRPDPSGRRSGGDMDSTTHIKTKLYEFRRPSTHSSVQDSVF